MTGVAIPDYSTIDLAWLLTCATMVLLMQAGFCLLESGLVRTKNTVNVAFKNLADFALCAVLYSLVGFGLMFGASFHGLFGFSLYHLGVDAEPWFLAFFLFQLMFCGTATTIVSGAVAERVRLTGYLWIAVLVSTIVYPMFGHWAWAGQGSTAGWLKRLGFVDFAGAAVVHQVGGWIALAAVLLIGPRLGKFRRRGISIEGHNMTLATLGLLLLWFGWYGFNGGSTLGVSDVLPRIIVNTSLAGSGGGFAILLLLLLSSDKPPLKNLITGCIAGLVSATAACHILSPLMALLSGAIAGLLCHYSTLILERAGVDDVVDAFAGHAVAGAWGSLSMPFLTDPSLWGTGHGRIAQLGVQALGVSVCFVWAFGIGGGLLYLINRWLPLRVGHEEERLGLNLAEHGIKSDLMGYLAELDRLEDRGELPSEMEVDPFSHEGQIVLKYTGVLRRAGSESRRAVRASRQFETSEAALHRRALYDELTGLASRELFEDRLSKAIRRSEGADGRDFTVAVVDVDRFRVIVDSLGREAGDELLKSIAARLAAFVDRDDIAAGERVAARLTGDEFGILLCDVGEREQAEEIARQMERAAGVSAHVVAGHEVVASLAVGVVVCDRSYGTAERILRHAAIAMRRAKSSPVRSVVLFDHPMREEAERRFRREVDLRRAVSDEQLALLYQPIVAPSGLGFEALVRWDHPDDGRLPPAEFLASAEEIGLIDEIGAWVLRTGVAQLAKWRRRAASDLSLSINVSSQQLLGEKLRQQLREVLATGEVPAEALILDVVERSVASHEELPERLAALRAMGVRIALDDFGSGHCSLDRLAGLPIDTIKIDRTLIEPIGSSRSHRWILRTIVNLAHAHGLTVTAEGIENPAQYERLMRIGCDAAQGFLFSPPLTEAEAGQWLELHDTGFFATLQRLGSYRAG